MLYIYIFALEIQDLARLIKVVNKSSRESAIGDCSNFPLKYFIFKKQAEARNGMICLPARKFGPSPRLVNRSRGGSRIEE